VTLSWKGNYIYDRYPPLTTQPAVRQKSFVQI